MTCKKNKPSVECENSEIERKILFKLINDLDLLGVKYENPLSDCDNDSNLTNNFATTSFHNHKQLLDVFPKFKPEANSVLELNTLSEVSHVDVKTQIGKKCKKSDT